MSIYNILVTSKNVASSQDANPKCFIDAIQQILICKEKEVALMWIAPFVFENETTIVVYFYISNRLWFYFLTYKGYLYICTT